MESTLKDWRKLYVQAEERAADLQRQLREAEAEAAEELEEFRQRCDTLIRAVQDGVEDRFLIENNFRLKEELDRTKEELEATLERQKADVSKLEKERDAVAMKLEKAQDEPPVLMLQPPELHELIRRMGLVTGALDYPYSVCPGGYRQFLELAVLDVERRWREDPDGRAA